MSDADQPQWLSQMTAVLDQLAARGTSLTLNFEQLDVNLQTGDRAPMHVRVDGRLSVAAGDTRTE